MKILYLISKYATVFGTLIKGLWEHLTCGILNVLVEDGRYLQPNELCGHVEHEFTSTRLKTFLLGWLPGIINAVLAFLLGGAGFMGLFILRVSHEDAIFWVYIVLFYLGVSFFCNMFPLYEDALNNWNLLYQQKLSDKDKEMNEEIKQKIKADKAYRKEAQKIAKESGKKVTNIPSERPKEKIKKETNIFFKIILFIPSVIMSAGSFLEKYGLTFILAIIITVLAAFLV